MGYLATPAAFLLLQLATFWLLPDSRSAAAYLFMVAGPLLACAGCVWRATREAGPARLGWYLMAAAVGLWAWGALSNLWHEWVLGDQNGMYRDAMLGFHLAAVPLTYLLAADWQQASSRGVRALDALLALGIGYGYFLVTWASLTGGGEIQPEGIAHMVWLVDVQNGVLALAAVVRWCAAQSVAERRLFEGAATHCGLYLVLAAVNNHLIAPRPDLGPEWGCLATSAFMALLALALQPPRERAVPAPPRWLARAVQGGSSLMVAAGLLTVSLFLIRVDYTMGTVGVLTAVLGTMLRNALAEVQHLAQGDSLRQQASALQHIAWTDALTGLSNRRFLAHRLDEVNRRGSPAIGSSAVLMIDIDHFKLLNDQAGHAAGDACLRAVAGALQLALGRPRDVLARYGGEEFIVLLLESDEAAAWAVAERLRAAVQDLAWAHPGSPWGVVTVSIGLACGRLAGDGAQALSLIHDADRALYEAKRAGRNRTERPGLAGDGAQPTPDAQAASA